MSELKTKRAVIFDEFSYTCDFFTIEGAYSCNCTNSEREVDEISQGKETKLCTNAGCPLGITAEEEDSENKNIDWDGLADDGKSIYEDEYMLIEIGKDASKEQIKAIQNWEDYLNKYNPDYVKEVK